VAGDNFQFGFDVLDGYYFNMKPDTDRVPYGSTPCPTRIMSIPPMRAATAEPSCGVSFAPGMPRGHHYPRQPRARFDQGPVPGGQLVVKREGKVTVYEVAIPWAELREWRPTPGQTFGFTFRINNNVKPDLLYGDDRSAVKSNGLSLHPYWQSKPSCGVRWALIE